MKAYQETAEQVIEQFKTNADTGLTKKEVQQRLKKYGPNTLPEKPVDPLWLIFLRQFRSPLIYILLAAAVILFFFGKEKTDAFILSGILIFNAIVGTFQEGRTRNILLELRRFFKTDCIVLRDGKKELIQDTDLVVGDIILLQQGERVPADARLISADNFRVDEAILTGESVPVLKDITSIQTEESVAERKNMIFRGTYAVAGSAKAVVVATGRDTQVGKIGTVAEEIQTDMPIKKELDRLSYVILFFIIVLCLALLIIGLLTGRPTQELIITLTALFICVIPEGLPVVLTLVLVTGVYRMAKKNVLVKRMQAVEGLGRTQVILTDKTGTLTRNEMMVACVCAQGTVFTVTGQGYKSRGDITVLGEDTKESQKKVRDLKQLGIAASLLNGTEITFVPKTGLFDIKGDPTEAALGVFAQKLDCSREKLDQEYEKLYEIPFHPTLRYHVGFYKKDGKGIIFINGSPEEIMKRSQRGPFSDKDQKCLEKMLQDGLRTVGFATGEFDLSKIPNSTDNDVLCDFYSGLLKNNLQFLGLCGIEDAIRSEVRAIVQQARDAGIKIVMVTGDHRETALYVAKKVGIFENGDEALDGGQVKNMSDEELSKKLDRVTVFSRLAPDQKLRIVKLLQKQNKIVAMTGDGINDVPSLVAADLGIAMGSIGAEVTKNTADLVLLDDSFASIISAIEQGRHIFYLLKRVVLYFLSTNLAEVLIVLFAFIVNLPLPLTAAQILWLNFVTDGFLDVGLAMEPQEGGLVYQKKWISGKMRLVDNHILAIMFFMAVPMAIGSLVVFIHYYQQNLALARTMTLLTMAFFQWFNAWNCRSIEKSIFSIGWLQNKWLIAATILVLLLQFAIVYVPFFQFIFSTVPLNAYHWLVVVGVASTIILWDELRKFITRYMWSTEAV